MKGRFCTLAIVGMFLRQRIESGCSFELPMRRQSVGHAPWKLEGRLMGSKHVSIRTMGRAASLAFLYAAGCLVLAQPALATTTVTQISYDAGDHVKSITDPRGLSTSYTYDGLGNLRSQTSPDTGTTTYGYDNYGRRTSMTRADGTITTYGYDGLSRITSISAGGQAQTFTYDTCTQGVGRLCAVADSTGTTSYTYSPEGWVTGRGFTIGSTTYALGYGYDALGQVASVVYPDGNQATYSYTRGVVSGVTLTVGGASVPGASAITYQPMNAGMSGWTSSNGVVNTLSYDTDGRLTGIHAGSVQSLDLGYDVANRVVSLANDVDPSMSQEFGYDDESRLVSVFSDADMESYGYDANGNRSSQTINGTSATFTYSQTSNQLTAIGGAVTASYGYDAQGNTTTENGAAAYGYNPFNRLGSANGATDYVSPEGQRLRKITSSGTTYFAPDPSGSLLAEEDSGAWVDYVWLNGQLIGRIAGTTVDAIHDDQTGRPQVVTNASESVVWKATNYPFEREVALDSIGGLNLGFPGQYYDQERGLWNNGFRDYSASLGRYIESDPLGLSGGINPYAYVGNSPISNADPLGLCPNCGTPPKLPPGVSVKANIQQMERLAAQEGASGDPFYTGLFSTFFHLVRYGGPWDYKTQDAYRGEYDDGGNFNYGAAGAAAGISTPLLRAAAGAAQIFHGSSQLAWIFNGSLGDEPKDVTQILAGIAYYQCLAAGGQ